MLAEYPDGVWLFDLAALSGTAESRSVRFDVVPDGQYRVYEVDLGAAPAYKGANRRLHSDQVPVGKPGEYVCIRSIGFRKPAP